MQKKELRQLRALPATKEMMQKGKNYKEITRVVGWKRREETVIVPEYELLLRVQNLKGYIKVAIFLPGDMRKDIRTPRYEIFLNPKGNEYITRELDKEGNEIRWLTSMAYNLDAIPWKPRCFISRDGMNTLKRLELKNDHCYEGFARLQAWQREQKDEDTKRREQREQEPWDQDMKLIPRLPKGFSEWMRKDACREFYIFYEYGTNEGLCSRCKKTVLISEPRHNEETTCPACKAKAVFKASKKQKCVRTRTYEAEIIQKIQGGIVIRTFEQHQSFRSGNYENPEIYLNEERRTLIWEDGSRKSYYYGLYKNKYPRWILDLFGNEKYIPEMRTYWWNDRIKVYKRNLAVLKKNSLLKYSAMDLWPELPTSVSNYIEIERAMPVIEKLAKIGMFRLATEIMKAKCWDRDELIEREETELAKILKIDKPRLKRLKAMDGGGYLLRWMQMEKNSDTVWSDEMLREFGENEIDPESLMFATVIEKSYTRIYSYLKKQAGIMGEDLEQARVTWRDYMNMAAKLKMNISEEQIAKPKDLKKAHDELVLLREQEGIERQAAGLEKKWPKVNGQLPKLKKFEFRDSSYCVVAPEKVADIVAEGVILRHCVHTCDYYFSRIQNDESYLFFLRKTSDPKMPWYTLEVEPSGNIRQKRTVGDKQNEDFKKALPFLQKWQRFFKKQLSKEEVALGEKADKLRKENYKKLREDGNRVWHGPLAGKLLADVLEADFMEAM